MTTLPLFSTLFRSPDVHLAQPQNELRLLQAPLQKVGQEISHTLRCQSYSQTKLCNKQVCNMARQLRSLCRICNNKHLT